MWERRIPARENIPTEAQRHTARISVYLDSIDVLKEEAKKHARTKRGVWGGRKFRIATEEQLIDLFVASQLQGGQVTEVQSDQSIRPKTEPETIFERVSPQLTQIDTRTMEQAAHLGKVKRAVVATRTTRLINRLSEEQSKHLLEGAGYTNIDARFISGKVATAVGWQVGTSIVGAGAALVGSTVEKAMPLFSNLTEGEFIASYAALYGIAGVLAWTNKILMDSPAVKTTANALATAGYFFTPRFFAEKWKQAAQWSSVVVGTYFPTLIGEILTWGAIGTLEGRQGIFGRNLASTAVEVLTIGGNIAYLAHKNKQAREPK